MGDSGEGLIDAEDRYQERLSERTQNRQRTGVASVDPERERRRRSLDLAKAELLRQESGTTNEIRRGQIREALAEIERQIAALES
jgi:hypothetical protein